jgi:hypothetical protein
LTHVVARWSIVRIGWPRSTIRSARLASLEEGQPDAAAD